MSLKAVEEPLSASEVSRETSCRRPGVSCQLQARSSRMQQSTCKLYFESLLGSAGPVSGVCLNASIGTLSCVGGRQGWRPGDEAGSQSLIQHLVRVREPWETGQVRPGCRSRWEREVLYCWLDDAGRKLPRNKRGSLKTCWLQ